ncbi:hypothetical protein Fot_06428 [Forsythia ovata]|uniref:Uncharacterized protein n=1 Tax=Forsythia ovata TaxID=205694 RepID=A0ABD1WSY3_9LAMI
MLIIKVKRKWVDVDKWEKVTPKRTLEDEGDTTVSTRFKRSQMAPQKTTGYITAFPSTMQVSIPDSSDWTECINIGSCQDELNPAILEKLPHFSTMWMSPSINIRLQFGQGQWRRWTY